MKRIVALIFAASLVAIPSPARAASRMPNYFYPVSLCATCQADAAGVPMYEYNGVWQYNPVTIEQTALYRYGQQYSTSFTAMADWLVANQTPDGLWLYTFPFRNQFVPWWSAMAEGQGISVLVRGASWPGLDPVKQATYLAAAQSAEVAMTRDMDQHGVLNGDWLEEYQPPANPEVLNGMIFAMAGLYDLDAYTGTTDLLWTASVASVALHLPAYVGSGGCFYDRAGLVESHDYDAVVNKELTWLYAVTGDVTFSTYAARFARHCA